MGWCVIYIALFSLAAFIIGYIIGEHRATMKHLREED